MWKNREGDGLAAVVAQPGGRYGQTVERRSDAGRPLRQGLDEGQDVELQLRDLRRHVEARGWISHREYIDEGVSGVEAHRPALEAPLDDCRKRKVDVRVVWRLDRLGRSLKHLVNTLDELRSLGVAFCSYHENLDFTTATGQLMFHLLAAFAEFEQQLILEWVRAERARIHGLSQAQLFAWRDRFL